MNSTPFKASALPGAGTIFLGLASLLSMVTGVHDIMQGRHLSQTAHFILFGISITAGIRAIDLLIQWAERSRKANSGRAGFQEQEHH